MKKKKINKKGKKETEKIVHSVYPNIVGFLLAQITPQIWAHRITLEPNVGSKCGGCVTFWPKSRPKCCVCVTFWPKSGPRSGACVTL